MILLGCIQVRRLSYATVPLVCLVSWKRTLRELVNLVILPVAESLQCSLEKFHNPQSLDGTSSCDVCGLTETFSCEKIFSKLPSILIFQIDRNVSLGTGSVYDTRKISFHEELQVQELQEDEQVTVQYRLRAVINHSGSLATGHNTAHVRRGNSWYFCDDGNVVKCRGPFNKNSQKTVFFFERDTPFA